METQTAGRLAQIRRYVKDDPEFFVTYGDGVANVNIAALLDYHRSHGRTATVTSVQIPSRFGVLSIDEQSGEVPHFEEKAPVDGWVNGGFFVFDQGVFQYLNDDVMLEQEPLTNLSKDGGLMAWRHYGFWQPMDTYRESTLLNELWDSGEAPWKVW